MQRAREPLRRQPDAGPGDDEFFALQHEDAMASDGRHRRQRIPRFEVGRRGRVAARVAKLDDHLGRAREHELGAHRHRLLFRVGEHVGAACRLEHVVQEADAAARVDPFQRSRLAAEHEQRLWTRTLGDTRADVGELALDPIRERVCGGTDADARAERSDRLGDVRQPAMHIWIDRNARAIQLRAQIRLRSVQDHEVGLQRENSLDIRIEQRPDARQLLDLRRKPIVAPDGDNPVARSHREQHLRRRRDDRDDAPRLNARLNYSVCVGTAKAVPYDRWHGCLVRRCDRLVGRSDRLVGRRFSGANHSERYEEQCDSSRHRNRRKSSHKKNGPPRSAVTAPTGMPTGPNAVRATRSQMTRNEPPKSAAAGSTRR